jgi:hypothetical protein
MSVGAVAVFAAVPLPSSREFGGIRRRIFPVIWRHDLGFDPRVLAEQVEQIRPVDELDRLVLGEVEAGLAVARGGDQDSLTGAFVLQRSEQIPDRGDTDSVLIALGLDYYFAGSSKLTGTGFLPDYRVRSPGGCAT